MTESEERNWTIFMHLSGFLGGFFVGLGCFLIPLVLWLIKRRESERIDLQGKEILNFQISLFMIGFGLLVVGAMVAYTQGVSLMILPLLFMTLIGLTLIQWLFGIIGTIKASEGKDYWYPLNLRLIG